MKLYSSVLIFTLIIFITPAIAHTHYCGSLLGYKIKTYGGLSCTKAKSIFKQFQKGKIPKGWNCGQSVGGCGRENQGFYFKN